jgi:hypothetical protein
MTKLNITPLEENEILDLWAAHEKTSVIAQRFDVKRRRIAQIAAKARLKGDPRAIVRKSASEMMKGVAVLNAKRRQTTVAHETLPLNRVRFKITRGSDPWSCLWIYTPIPIAETAERFAKIDQVLTLWVGGADLNAIKAATGLNRNVIHGIVRRSRKNGDLRAIKRGPPKPTQTHEASEPSPAPVKRAPAPVVIPEKDRPVLGAVAPKATAPLPEPVTFPAPETSEVFYEVLPVSRPAPRQTSSLSDIERRLAEEEKALFGRLSGKAPQAVNGSSHSANGQGKLSMLRLVHPPQKPRRERIPEDFISGRKPEIEAASLPPYGQRLITQLRSASDSGPGDCKYATEYHPCDSHRHRFCGRPAVIGYTYCAEHALKVVNWNSDVATARERKRLERMCEPVT